MPLGFSARGKARMKAVKLALSILALLCAVVIANAFDFAASPSPGLLKAKQEAEAKGYLFEASHEEILAKAKKEGKLQVLNSLNPDIFPHMTKEFKEKFPFIDLQLREITGTETAQRHIHELRTGGSRNWDVSHLTWDFFNDYLPHVA